MCKKLGKKCPTTLEGFRRIYGQRSSELYNQLSFSEEDKRKANVIYKEEIMKKESKLFEGIIRVINVLSKKYSLAVASSSYTEEVMQKLDKFCLSKYFKYILGRQHYISEFNKIGLIEEIIKKMGLKHDEVILIGDRNVDFVDGTKAGLKNIILVDYGWGYNLNQIPNYKKKVTVKKPSEIIGAIEKY